VGGIDPGPAVSLHDEEVRRFGAASCS
jgi:hypothetical protein